MTFNWNFVPAVIAFQKCFRSNAERGTHYFCKSCVVLTTQFLVCPLYAIDF